MGPVFFKTLIGNQSEKFVTEKLIQPRLINVLKTVSNNFRKRFNSGSTSFRPDVKIVSYNKGKEICEENFEKRINEIFSKMN